MAQIFPKRANILPLASLLSVLVTGVVLVCGIWYYFSPRYTDVGYAPVQPVPYSHRLHANELGLDCRYCHSNVERAPHANIPATQTCMNCHSQIRTASPKLALVRESWAADKPIEWIRVHKLPDYAHFNHAAHVNVGVGCETCHGRIDQMEIVTQQQPLSMGWCLACHRSPEEYLRPVEEITTMGWTPAVNQVSLNLERIRREGIKPPENCSACHY